MSNELLELSPKFIAYTTPDALLVENLAAHLHQHYQNATVVLIGSPLAADQLLEQRFKAAFAAVPTSQSKLKLQEATWSDYQKFKTVGGPQLLVSFSSDRSKVQGLLKAAALDSNLLVVGHKDWIDYKELDAPEVRNQPFLVALPITTSAILSLFTKVTAGATTLTSAKWLVWATTSPYISASNYLAMRTLRKDSSATCN